LSLLLHCFMLFEELIQQHRVHLLVSDCLRFSFFVEQYQGRVHPGYFLGDQTKARRVFWVALVVEGHWPERKDHFTGLAHGVNVPLEPCRGLHGTKLAGGVNKYRATRGGNVRTAYTADSSLRGTTT